MNNESALRGKRFLIVEDDYYLATDEAAALEAAGAIVVGCTGKADEAHNLIGEEALDCALVDINLGHGPAFDIARTLRDRQIPFLFTTGYDAAAIPQEFCDIPRLEKPFTHPSLLAILERLL